MSTVTLSAHECSALFGLPPIGDTVLSGRDAPPTFLVYCGDGMVLTHYMSAHPSTCVVKADVCDGEASCVMHGAEAKHVASMVGKNDSTLTIADGMITISTATDTIKVSVEQSESYDAYVRTLLESRRSKTYRDRVDISCSELSNGIKLAATPTDNADHTPALQRYIRLTINDDAPCCRLAGYSPRLCVTTHVHVEHAPQHPWDFLLQPSTLLAALAVVSGSSNMCSFQQPERGSYCDLTIMQDGVDFFFRIPAIRAGDSEVGTMMTSIDNIWTRINKEETSTVTIDGGSLAHAWSSALKVLGASGAQLQCGTRNCRISSTGNTVMSFYRDIPCVWGQQKFHNTHGKFSFPLRTTIVNTFVKAQALSGSQSDMPLTYGEVQSGAVFCMYETDHGETTIYSLMVTPEEG